MLQSLSQIGHSVAQGLANFGGFLFSICIVVAGACATAFCIGVFFEQQAKLFKLNEYSAVGNGLKFGALCGAVFSIFAIYQLGNVTALFSLIGLAVALLLLSGATALVREQVRPTPVPQD